MCPKLPKFRPKSICKGVAMVRNRENPKVRKTAETEKRPKSPKNGPKIFVTVRNSHPSVHEFFYDVSWLTAYGESVSNLLPQRNQELT